MKHSDVLKGYQAAKIPQVNLERNIIASIKETKKTKMSFNFRTAVIVCLLVVMTTVIGIAVSRIIENEDGSHSLLDNKDQIAWELGDKPVEEKIDNQERLMIEKLITSLKDMTIEENEAKVAYLKYEEDKEAVFAVLLNKIELHTMIIQKK